MAADELLPMMKKCFFACCCLAAASVGAAADDWTLVFEDDFSGSSIDASKWGKIDYVNYNVAAWRRFQSQDDVLYVSNGETLELWGRYGDYTSQSDQTGENPGYACAGICTLNTFSFQYGKVEVRARYDSVLGVWPAIWLLPVKPETWLTSGEIDIMEHLNYEGGVRQTLHYPGEDGKDAASYATINKSFAQLGVAGKDAWHTYGMEWTADAITFSVDGIETETFTADGQTYWPFGKEGAEFYLIIDQQIGGEWVENIGVNKGIDQSTLANKGALFEVDSVKVYSTENYRHSSLPEPASTALSLLAMAGMAARRRRAL